jgi:hypothetical protein
MSLQYLRLIGEKDGYSVQRSDAVVACLRVPSLHKVLQHLHLSVVRIPPALDVGAYLQRYQWPPAVRWSPIRHQSFEFNPFLCLNLMGKVGVEHAGNRIGWYLVRSARVSSC